MGQNRPQFSAKSGALVSAQKRIDSTDQWGEVDTIRGMVDCEKSA